MNADKITWNVGNGSRDRVERDFTRLLNMEPLLVGMQEVFDRRAVLREVARESGWQHIQAPGAPGHVAALLHPEARLDGWGVVQLNPRTYVGKNVAGARDDGYAQAKWILVVRYTLPGGRREVTGVTHYVPSAMRRGNRLARQLHYRQVTRTSIWLEKRRRPAYLLVDANAALNKPREAKMLTPLRDDVRLLSAPSHGRRAIDIIGIPKNSRGKVRTVNTSSDHDAVVLYDSSHLEEA